MDKEGEPKTKLPTGLVRIEKSISPERVWGKDFRIPSIVGEGSGLGFKIENLHLPKDWETKISELKKINYEHFYNVFKQECEEFELKPGLMKYDSKGILRELTINTSPVSKLYLNLEFQESEGNYKSENIMHPLTAIVMQKFTAKFLNLLLEKDNKLHRGYPYIAGGWGHFCPMNLIVPEKFMKSEEVLYSQEAFKIEASNILGRFGFTLKNIFFDEKNGLLTSFSLSEGLSCGFYIERTDGVYCAHNVDDSYQAAALFGVGATYINHLLEYET